MHLHSLPHCIVQPWTLLIRWRDGQARWWYTVEHFLNKSPDFVACFLQISHAFFSARHFCYPGNARTRSDCFVETFDGGATHCPMYCFGHARILNSSYIQLRSSDHNILSLGHRAPNPSNYFSMSERQRVSRSHCSIGLSCIWQARLLDGVSIRFMIQ